MASIEIIESATIAQPICESIARKKCDDMVDQGRSSMGIKPIRLRLSRSRGADLQKLSMKTNGLEAVNCARPGIWGNPFVVGFPSGYRFMDGSGENPMIAALTTDQAIEFYEDAGQGYIRSEMHPWGHDWIRKFRRRFSGTNPKSAAMVYLAGKNLACYCEKDSRCHCDVLLEWAAGREYSKIDDGFACKAV